MYYQGARWDSLANTIDESKLKELHPQLPLIHIKAVTQETYVRSLGLPLSNYIVMSCRINKIWNIFMNVLSIQPGREVDVLVLVGKNVKYSNCRTNLHLDIQLEDERKDSKVGFGRSCSPSPDLEMKI